MQTPSMTSSASRLVRSMADLIDVFEQSQQPRGNWRIGTETEKFGVVGVPPQALPYEGPVSVLAEMAKLATRFGWAPESEMPAWGNAEKRAILWEATAAAGFLLAGSQRAGMSVEAKNRLLAVRLRQETAQRELDLLGRRLHVM